MSSTRVAIRIALVATLTATTVFTAVMGAGLVVTGIGIEKVVGALVVATAAVMLAAGLDGSVLHGRVTERVPAWALHGALPVCGIGAVGLSLLHGTQTAGALAGLLLLPATAYIVLGLASGQLRRPREAPEAGKRRQRRGGRRR